MGCLCSVVGSGGAGTGYHRQPRLVGGGFILVLQPARVKKSWHHQAVIIATGYQCSPDVPVQKSLSDQQEGFSSVAQFVPEGLQGLWA